MGYYKLKSPVDDWGGWKGNPNRPPSTSFPRECDEPIRGGRPDLDSKSRFKRDLQLYSCGTVLDLHQLRRVPIVIDL
jgi:hypothetical protein